MPPKEKRQPSANERRSLVQWMQRALDQAAERLRREPRAVMRRLTREPRR
jgi:hypothetical protein